MPSAIGEPCLRPSTAIILAAGVGSRLRPMTDSLPKCLVPVAGHPLLGWQLRAFFGAGLQRVVVVAGYRHRQVADFCQAFGPRVSVIVNDTYATTNNMFSLCLGVQAVGPQDLLLCNGDVMFDASIPSRLLAASHPHLIAADKGRFIEESMKIVVNDGRVSQISKRIAPERAWGVSIDVYRFGRVAMEQIVDVARRFIYKNGQVDLWTEAAIDAALPYVDVRPFDIGGCPWAEIDTQDDLADAGRLFSHRNSC